MLPFIYVFGKPVALYGLCIAAGIFFSSIAAYFLTKKSNILFEDFIVYAAVGFGFGFLGAKLLYIFIGCPLSSWKTELLYLVTDRTKAASGFVFYGGLIAGFFSIFIARKITDCSIKSMDGVFAVCLPLVHCFGRLGCFCAGCCYGIKTDIFFGVVYSNPVSSVERGVRIFPVQLLEAILLFLVFVFLFFRYLKYAQNEKKRCLLVFEYLIIYSFIRFFTEFLRGDIERGVIFGISTSQFISLLLFLAAMTVYLKMKTSKKEVS